MRGFEWLTEEEMTGKNWSQQGDERLRELEELMSATGRDVREGAATVAICLGLWSEKFSMDLGDMLEVSDDEGEGNAPAGSGGKKKPNPFPSVDGDESLKEMLARYKKACLNRDDFINLEKVAGKAKESVVNNLFRDLCEMEVSELKKNPEYSADSVRKVLQEYIARTLVSENHVP
ncbi:unnamed protein product [Effrenium voratum]|nr:unnamed protein product [Effrenium voratum]